MADAVNIHEAKTNLSKLISRVEDGEVVVIARGGVPVADLVAHAEQPVGIRPGRGAWRGELDMTGFDAADPEIAGEFLAE